MFNARGYDEGFVKEQVERVRNLDRQVLIEQDVGRNRGRGDRIPFVVSYQPLMGLDGLLVSYSLCWQ